MNRQIEYGLIPRGPGFSYKLSTVTNNINLYASIIAPLSKLDVTADIKFKCGHWSGSPTVEFRGWVMVNVELGLG